MSKKPTSPETLYGTGRDYLREQIKTNEILADIAGVEYTPPEGVPKGKYMENKWLLDAAEKKNELLEEIAEGGPGGGSAAAKAIGIDYATDGIFLKNKNGDTIQGSGATLPAYGVTFDPATGGLTLTKNGTAMQGQTVTIPNYGSPVGVDASADMTDHDKIYLYLGTTGGGLTNGHFYYWDGSAWADGGEYAAATVQTDKTLLVEDRAADAKATGDAVNSLKTQLTELSKLVAYEPTTTKDRYIDVSTGKELLTNSYKSFDVFVIPGTKYLYRSGANEGAAGCAFYDRYGNFIDQSGILGTLAWSEITVPANAVIGKFCFRKAVLTSDNCLKYEANTQAIVEYTVNNKTALQDLSKLSPVTPESVVENTYILISNGNETTTNSYNTIKVSTIPGTKYLYRTGANEETVGCAFFDANDTFIDNSGIAGNKDFTEITVPNNAAYGKFCYRKVEVTSATCLMFESNIQNIIDAAVKSNQLSDGNLKILCDRSDVYKRATVNNGTKTRTYNSVTATSNASGAGTRVQLILFSDGTSQLNYDTDRIGLNNGLIIEFDVTGTATGATMAMTGSSSDRTYNIESGKHYRLAFELLSFTYILVTFPISDGKTLTISNLIVYQGDKNVNVNFYRHDVYNSIAKSIFLSIGDSLTNAGGGGDGAVNLRWQTGITNKFHMKEYTTSGAIGALVANIGSNTIYSQVMAMTRDSDVGLISFWGGTNDWGGGVQLGDFDTQIDPTTRNNTTFYGGLLDCVEKLLTLYPDKPIFLVGTTQRIQNIEEGITSNNTPNTNGDYLHEFVDAVKKVAKYYSIPFIDLYRNSGINEITAPVYFYAQPNTGGGNHYLHFSDEGEKQVSKILTAFVSSVWDFNVSVIKY